MVSSRDVFFSSLCLHGNVFVASHVAPFKETRTEMGVEENPERKQVPAFIRRSNSPH